jgi:hypothetical protein
MIVSRSGIVCASTFTRRPSAVSSLAPSASSSTRLEL